jgi:hypothetical protein
MEIVDILSKLDWAAMGTSLRFGPLLSLQLNFWMSLNIFGQRCNAISRSIYSAHLSKQNLMFRLTRDCFQFPMYLLRSESRAI